MAGETVIISANHLESVSKMFGNASDDLQTAVDRWRSGILGFTKPTGSDETSQMLGKLFDVLTTAGDRFTDIVDGLHGLSTDLHTMAQNYVLTEQANQS